MIIFENVTKDFGIGTPALQNVSFTIEPGEFIFLTGHSGAGKTTLARLITKEYHPSEGKIFFDGDDLEDIPRSKVHHHRRRIGVIYQDYKLLPDMTVRENIALALEILGKKKEEIDQRIQDLLQLVQLPEKDNLFPSQLSGGEAQRISIARALATAPSVLFADEPTGNLDPDNSKLIMQILNKVNQVGTTVIMATHDEKIVTQTPHRVFVLRNGQLDIKGDKKPAKQNKVDITIQKSSDNSEQETEIDNTEESES